MLSTRNRKTKAAKKAATPTKAKAKAKATRPTTPKPEAVSEPAASVPPAETAAKPLSGLDAAAQVLREADEPLNVQVLVTRILERGLWSTGGKTPAATIYSAMIREIKAKGSDSRFQKVDRGRFAVA